MLDPSAERREPEARIPEVLGIRACDSEAEALRRRSDSGSGTTERTRFL
jgi:hypothetical protein